MGHKEPMSIAAALRQIQQAQLILPAIQREYVWKPSQVVRMFDSIMRGYPVGSFLSWKVQPETISKFKFYGFMKDYSAFNNRHNPVVDIPTDREVVAVLDGQQRLTSLNIGLRGTYAYRIRGGWSNKPWAYPERRLYLNVLGEAPENELGLRYLFQFLTKEEVDAANGDSSRMWFPVSEVYESAEASSLSRTVAKYGLGNDVTATDMVWKIWDAVHKNASLHFYEEDVQDIERVLDIFVRVNSGGTVLSYSDLLLSIATAQWEGDARAEVHNLVDSLNQTGTGFDFSRDTILKAGLVLADVGDIAFKVKNFTTANMAKLESDWVAVSKSLHVAVGLLGDFGLSGGALTADSVLIPVAYYVHSRKLDHKYRQSPKDKNDREALRSWVLRSLIVRGVWGSGLDTLLRELREVIKSSGGDSFPAAEFEKAMAQRGKSLELTDALIEDVLLLEYGKARTFAVLAVLFPHVDTRNVFHVDHVYPAARFDGKVLAAMRGRDGSARFTGGEISNLLGLRDTLPNLELLQGQENVAKSDKAPDDWLIAEYPTSDDRTAFLERNALPETLPHSIDDFPTFYAQRKNILMQRLRAMLKTHASQPVAAEVGLDAALAEGDEQD